MESFIKMIFLIQHMDFKRLFDGFKVPDIGFGTYGIGGFREADLSQDDKSIEVIKEAINLGYTHIDTAELYGAGHSEELIGKAINEFDRSRLIITTKVFRTNLKRDDLISACKKSLERLQIKEIDIYLIHAPSLEIPLKETMEAMDYLVEQKLVKYIGVSNFSVEQMKEAQKYSKNKIAVNQIPYNLNTRNKDTIGKCVAMESETIPYCQENNIIVMAYRPIERGLVLKDHALMDSLAEKYNKTKAQIALNWLISKKNIIVIPKASSKEHLKENLDATGWNLSEEDMKLLDDADFENPSPDMYF